MAGLAIQWGAIGNVGMVAKTFGNMDVNIIGTKPQSIGSCLDSLDSLLNGPQSVVSSYVLADKSDSAKCGKKEEIMQSIGHVLGMFERRFYGNFDIYIALYFKQFKFILQY